MKFPSAEQFGATGARIVDKIAYVAPEVRDLQEQEDNKKAAIAFFLLTGVGGTLCCGGLLFFATGAGEIKPAATKVPDRIVLPTNPVWQPTSTPHFVTPEMLTPDNLCITVHSGDTAGEIFKKLVEMGHDPNKPVRYFPPNSANPQLYMSNNLPWRIDPKGIFCGQR